MERIIEKDKTYRIPKRDGTTELLHVLKIGDNIEVKNLNTGKKERIKKEEFQKKLNAGEIYVSANLIAALKKIIS